jgi:hypothetical protein
MQALCAKLIWRDELACNWRVCRCLIYSFQLTATPVTLSTTPMSIDQSNKNQSRNRRKTITHPEPKKHSINKNETKCTGYICCRSKRSPLKINPILFFKCKKHTDELPQSSSRLIMGLLRRSQRRRRHDRLRDYLEDLREEEEDMIDYGTTEKIS